MKSLENQGLLGCDGGRACTYCLKITPYFKPLNRSLRISFSKDRYQMALIPEFIQYVFVRNNVLTVFVKR